MAHYIINSLEAGEQIVLQGRLHWISICQYLLFGFILILVAGSLVASGYFMSRLELFIIGAGVFVLAIVILIVGRFIRTRREFAVTTSPFIQKDGILNIKMTEMRTIKTSSKHLMGFAHLMYLCGLAKMEMSRSFFLNSTQ